MGIHWLPSIELYWSNEWVFAIPQFKTVMNWFHYQKIKSHLYFSNPSETHIYQLEKIQHFLTLFQTQCREQFYPPQIVSINEIMVKTKSKFSKYKIRNPKKPIRDGIKIKVLCDLRIGCISKRFIFIHHQIKTFFKLV
jgi:predicted nucleotidyltransferase